LIGAKEEVRKLMSVLLQRESKYNHEIRFMAVCPCKIIISGPNASAVLKISVMDPDPQLFIWSGSRSDPDPKLDVNINVKPPKKINFLIKIFGSSTLLPVIPNLYSNAAYGRTWLEN
jgi:hypothetical protein